MDPQDVFSAGHENLSRGGQVISLPPKCDPGVRLARRSSPRFANKSLGSITQKALTRKMVLREGLESGGLKGPHTYGKKKIAKKSKQCGVLLSEFDAQVFEAFLQGNA